LFEQNDHPDSTKPRSEQHLLIVEPIGRDRFAARLDGRLLVRSSRTPLCDAARVLIAEGADPDSIIVMRHAGSSVDSFRARLSVAAALAVEERESRAPRFVRWRPLHVTDGSPGTAADGSAGISLPEAAE
jgi:hypothetical protein